MDVIARELDAALREHEFALVIPWGLGEEASIVDVAEQVLHSARAGDMHSSQFPLPIPFVVEGALVEVKSCGHNSSPQEQLKPFVAAYPGWRHVQLLSSKNLHLAVLAGDGSGGADHYTRQLAKTSLLHPEL